MNSSYKKLPAVTNGPGNGIARNRVGFYTATGRSSRTAAKV